MYLGRVSIASSILLWLVLAFAMTDMAEGTGRMFRNLKRGLLYMLPPPTEAEEESRPSKDGQKEFFHPATAVFECWLLRALLA